MGASLIAFSLLYMADHFRPPPAGAFKLYDVDNDGFITRQEMYDIVDAIFQMVVGRAFH